MQLYSGRRSWSLEWLAIRVRAIRPLFERRESTALSGSGDDSDGG